MAAGLSLAEQNAALLRRRLNENCSLKEEDMEEKIHIDIAMPITYPTMELVQEWDILAPFGRENPRPVFADKNLKIRRMFLVGKKQNVLRLQLGNDEGKTVPAVLFKDVEGFFGFLKDKFGEVEVEKARSGRENEIRLSVVYAPKLNTYMGETSLQFEIQFFC